MTSDLVDLNSLLKSDSNKFLDNLKNSYLNILDVGVNDINKHEIRRSFDSLKSLSGIFELNEITAFIIEVENLLNKIIDSNIPFLTNDILNDLFVVKEQIDKLFQNYWQENIKSFDEDIIKENNNCIKILNAHLINYLNNSKEDVEITQEIDLSKDEDSTNEIIVQNSNLIFSPSSLTVQNSQEMKNKVLEHILTCESIDLELFHVNEIDTSGIQLIISIQNYCVEKNKVCNIKSISSLVEKRLEMLGVNL